MMETRQFTVGMRVARIRVPVGEVKVGDEGTIIEIRGHSTVRVRYDKRGAFRGCFGDATQDTKNLAIIAEAPPPPPTPPKPDPALLRDGFSHGAALQLADKLKAAQAEVKPPIPSGRWWLRHEWKLPRPMLHRAFAGLAKILKGG